MAFGSPGLNSRCHPGEAWDSRGDLPQPLLLSCDAQPASFLLLPGGSFGPRESEGTRAKPFATALPGPSSAPAVLGCRRRAPSRHSALRVCRDYPGQVPLSGGSLSERRSCQPCSQSTVLFFAPNPGSVLVLSCCQVDTPFVSPDTGEKKTEFSPHSGPAALIPLQEEAPSAPRQAALLGLLCPAVWFLRVSPAFAQDVSSSPWQVFLRQPTNWACGQLEIRAPGGGLTP